jgi:MFS family permease
MTPVLPLFIVELGGSSIIVGLIGGLGDAVANIVKVFSGYIADLTGRRKRLISIGYGIPFFAKFGIGIATTWEQVLVLKPIERLGKGIRGAPRDSLVADSVSFDMRGKAFGFHRTMDSAGAIVGSILALVIVVIFFDQFSSSLTTLQLIIIVSAFISLLAIIPIFFLHDSDYERNLKRGSREGLLAKLKKLPFVYYKLLIISTIFGLANFTILIYIIHTKIVILGIDDTISPLLQTAIPIFLFIWFNITYTVLSIPFGSLSDRYSRKTIFAIGLILYILTAFGMAVTDNFGLLIIIFGLYGAFNAATDGIQKAYTVDLIPFDLKGTGIGFIQTMMGIASVLGGIVAGALYSIEPSLAFVYGGFAALMALILLLIWNLQPVNSTTIV